MRRGKESSHIKYGEANAILAGDALHDLAFEIISSDNDMTDAAKIKAAGGKAQCVMEDGLVHGYLRGRKEASKIKDSFTRIVQAARILSKTD